MEIYARIGSDHAVRTFRRDRLDGMTEEVYWRAHPTTHRRATIAMMLLLRSAIHPTPTICFGLAEYVLFNTLGSYHDNSKLAVPTSHTLHENWHAGTSPRINQANLHVCSLPLTPSQHRATWILYSSCLPITGQFSLSDISGKI
jgi:hypothetical protein